MKKVLITAQAHPLLQNTLSENGYEVFYEPGIKREGILALISELTGLVVTTRVLVDKELLNKASALQWIGRLGSGLEHIDTEFASTLGINCFSTPEGNCTSVGEHSLGMLLSLLHRIVISSAEVNNNVWIRNENRGIELTGKTVGIIGLGHTGSAFTKVLRGFDLRILAYDKNKDEEKYVHGAIPASLQEIQAKADVISFHLPYTTETHRFADKDFFDGLSRSPVIINTSRGAIVDGSALLHALEKEQISGACLDVLENEKINSLSAGEREIFKLMQTDPRILLTPHIAGYSMEASYKMSAFLLQKLGMVISKSSSH